jgi:flagellar protein FliO/FliZ
MLLCLLSALAVTLSVPSQAAPSEGDDLGVSAKFVVEAAPEVNPSDAANSALEPKVPEGASTKPIDTNKLSEAQIPVLSMPLAGPKSNSFDYQRLILTLSVITVLAGAATYGLKRWAAKSSARSAGHTKIKVLVQHHLGPKKSLAIIQVAGESLLIGLTDHNISMLKTLSLLDEEIPDRVPNRFDTSMSETEYENENDDMDEDEHGGRDAFAMRGIGEIRDVVSTRLRGLKNLGGRG